MLLLVGCNTTKKSQGDEPSPVSATFNADSAYLFCQQQCDFGPRTMNSEAHERCAEWIQQRFTQYGYQVEMQRADLRGYDGTTLKATNIIAISPQHPTPNTPHNATLSEREHLTPNTRLLLCAHWDSRPWADNDPDSANWRKPVLAANDGASGVAVMLELARQLQQHDSLNVAVDFICFDAEDWGIPQWENKSDADSWALGAQYWATNTHHPSPNTHHPTPNTYRYAILLDMVGGQGAKFYHEGYSLQHARSIVENHYPECPQSNFGPTWHTVNDDMQHIDRNTLEAVGQTLLQVIFSEKE